MQLSRRSEYALLALIDLATESQQERVQLHEIADRQGIPGKYLEQLLRPLKSAGLIIATRGSRGGYQLARQPAEITALEVIEAVEGPLTGTEENDHPAAGAQVVRALWAAARDSLRGLLGQTTLAELVEQYGAARRVSSDWVI